MTPISAPAGQRTVIRTRNHSSMVTDYHFTVTPANPAEEIHGTLEIIASQWIFPGTPKTQPLQSRHSVTAGMFNTFFKIAVIPQTNVIIHFTDAEFTGKPKSLVLPIILIAAALIIIGAAAAMFVR